MFFLGLIVLAMLVQARSSPQETTTTVLKPSSPDPPLVFSQINQLTPAPGLASSFENLQQIASTPDSTPASPETTKSP